MPRMDAPLPQSVRFWNYLVGGKDNFEPDREAARRVLAVLPVIAEAARSERQFLGRVVRYLAAEAGIRQFLDLGTGIPTAASTHEVAQCVAPQSRVVYVHDDPAVLAHARPLLTSTPEGRTSYVEADVRDPDAVVCGAADTLDFSQPIAIIMIGILNFIADFGASREIVARFARAVPSGSYLAIEHPASDLDPAVSEAARQWNQTGSTQIVIRTKAEVARYFDGLDLVPPGLVELQDWRPDVGAPTVAVPLYAGLARKPLTGFLIGTCRVLWYDASVPALRRVRYPVGGPGPSRCRDARGQHRFRRRHRLRTRRLRGPGGADVRDAGRAGPHHGDVGDRPAGRRVPAGAAGGRAGLASVG